MAKSNSTAYHQKHEEITDLIYNTPGMLPHRYVFVLTNRCNLSCSFCFQEKKPSKDRMSSYDWILLTKQLPEYSRVTITGGEPFIFDGFEDVFRFVAKRYPCNVISNGILLSKDIIDLLLSHEKFKVLSISIDNVGNTVRGVSPEKWNKMEEGLRCFTGQRDLWQAECKLDIKTMILDENAADLYEIHQYCVEELGCDTHVYQFLKGSSLQHSNKMYKLEASFEQNNAHVYENFQAIMDQLNKIREYSLRTGKKVFIHPKLAPLDTEAPLPNLDYINVSHHVKEKFLPCKYPWASVHINHDGNLIPCMGVPMGNVRKTPLKSIIDGEAFTRFRDVLRREGTVNGCNRCGWIRPRLNQK